MNEFSSSETEKANADSSAAASSYSANNTLVGPYLARAREALATAGVRLLPFNFGSALAIASDVDGSGRDRYFGYVGQLVALLGLDFGDSNWLQWQVTNRRGRGLGFLSPDLNTGADSSPELFAGTRTFLESVAEFHQGNIDHFHAFYGNGPRLAILPSFERRDDGRMAFTVGAVQKTPPWRCSHFHIVGLWVVGKPGRQMQVRSATVVAADGTETDGYLPTPFAAPPGDRQHCLFTLRPGEGRGIPRLEPGVTVVIEMERPSASENVDQLILTSTYGDIVLERLEYLRGSFGVDLNLVTEHSALHFRNPRREKIDDQRLKSHLASYKGPLEAYFGTFRDDRGVVAFSTDADHPQSVCRVFPAISTDMNLRFVAPLASCSDVGFDPLNLVTPSATRAGGGIYWARRVLPNQDGATDPQMGPQAPKRADFAGRLVTMMTSATRHPGLCWPIYTHLGALPGEGARVPDPYLPPGPLYELQDRVFNISGKISESARLWFTRASVLYDYALMLRSIVSHIDRADANSVLITSWRDSCLGKILPHSASQLYGLTFYVDDPAKADIRLDGEPIETLVVNPAEETGRQSVSIAECGIRQILFDKLDPLANAPTECALSGAVWSWRASATGERSHGRLSVVASARASVEKTPASLTIPLHGWTAEGAQLISFELRCLGADHIALILTTLTGARFLFGQAPPVAANAERFTAVGDFTLSPRQGEAWRRFTVPFHDLAWNSANSVSNAFPSHPLDSLTIQCSGPPGAAVEVARVTFLRPRAATAIPNRAPGFCLGGRLILYNSDDTVQAVRRDRQGDPVRQTAVDQRGWFCFEHTAPGIYEVWSEHGGGIVHDRRGRLVEVGEDMMTLVMEYTSPAGE